MANEAVLMFETTLPIPFICADGTGIEQGSAVKLTDPFTVAITAGAQDLCGGITAAEKIASNGELTVPVYRTGIFKVVASGNIGIGDPVSTAAAAFTNRFYTILANVGNLSGNRIWGTSLEIATTGESFLMELNSEHSIG